MKKRFGLREIMFRALTFMVVGFLSAEALVRVFLWGFANPSDLHLYASSGALEARYGANFLGSITRYTPHRYLEYIPTPGFSTSAGDRHNSLGYRGEELIVPKPEGVFRIATLGGSTTYGFGVAHYEDSFPHKLQQLLRSRGFPKLEVVNAGASSYSTWESLINLQLRVLDLEPDLVLVYHGTNDAALRMVWPPAAYRGDNSGARSPWQGGSRSKASWFEWSAALRFIAVRMGCVMPSGALAEHWDKRAATYYSDEFVKQQRQGEYPDGVFLDVTAEEMMASNTPVYFERNVRSLVSTANANGVVTVLTTFAFSSKFQEEPRVSHPVYAQAMNESNQILVKIAAESDAHLFDLAKRMPEDKAYFTDGRHFTREGNALRAELCAGYLEEAALLPVP